MFIFKSYLNLIIKYIFVSVIGLNTTVVFSNDTFNIFLPDIPHPHNQVFNQIKTGITNSKLYGLTEYSIDLSQLDQSFNKAKNNINTDPIIALSTPILNKVTTLNLENKIYAAALETPPNDINIASISIYIDPRIYFNFVKEISPNIKTIRAIMKSQYENNHIKYSKKMANELGLELLVYKANDYREAIQKAKNIIDDTIPETDMIWITRDVLSFNFELILTYFIENTWDKKIISMSHSPLATKRGILFSLYPDYISMGEQLANIIDKPETTNKIHYLQNPQLSFNFRTAKHLNLKVDNNLSSKINKSYPSK